LSPRKHRRNWGLHGGAVGGPRRILAVATRADGYGRGWRVVESQLALHESIDVLRESAQVEREFARILRLRGNLEAARAVRLHPCAARTALKIRQIFAVDRGIFGW